jgi:hypothetical protein
LTGGGASEQSESEEVYADNFVKIASELSELSVLEPI